MVRTQTGGPVRLNYPVTHHDWKRLARIARLRLKRLGITQEAAQAAGGPSVSWMTKLPHQEGPVSVRQDPHLARLDRALHWPEGTSRGIVDRDRAGWSEQALEDEADELVHLTDKRSNAAWLIEQRLRAMPDEVADDMIRELFRVLGMPVRDPGKG